MIAALTLSLLLAGRQTPVPFPFLSGWIVPAKGEVGGTETPDKRRSREIGGVGVGGPDLASLIPHPVSRIPHPVSRIPYPASRIPYPASRIPYPASRIPNPVSRISNPESPLLALSTSRQAIAHEFVAAKGEWIQKPVSLASLRSKVVLVDFWAYTCVNCIRTFPYLKEWYRRYHKDGLEIVAIHRPEFDFEGQRANVVAATKRFGFTFPVLNDLEGKNWDNYNINAWPTKILINGQGQIVGSHIGEGDYAQTESTIQRELQELHPNLKFNGTMPPVRPTDVPGAVCQVCTLETYAANLNISHFTPDQEDRKVLISYPPKMDHGLYYNGNWTPTREYIQEDGNAGFKFKYMAKEVNSVLSPTQGTVKVTVYQDGQPANKADLGDDVKMMNGLPTMIVDQPRMYSVLRNRQWGTHQIELRFDKPGVRFYTLTFGTDCRPLPRTHRK